MSTVTIEEATASLTQLIHHLTPGDEVVITQDNRPIARLLPVEAPHERQLGTLRGTVLDMAPDFDAPLDDFAGDEVAITEGKHPVAKITPTDSDGPCRLGALRGTVLYMAPDFDAPLEDFKEYME